jgi:hypothetical protein
VVWHLELLGSLEEQRTYERDVPIADVLGELRCGWLDDLRFRDQTRNSSFTDVEWCLLEDFTELFDRVLSETGADRYPEPTLAELHAHPAWLRLAQAANETADRIRCPGGDT